MVKESLTKRVTRDEGAGIKIRGETLKAQGRASRRLDGIVTSAFPL